jgi:lactoylglutathione lyase
MWKTTTKILKYQMFGDVKCINRCSWKCHQPPVFINRMAFMSTTTPTGGNEQITLCGSDSNSITGSDTVRKRPFAILGVQQIAIGYEDRRALHHLWYTIFGLQPTVQNITIASENVCEDIIRLGGTTEATAIEIDLMTPLDMNKSPKVHVPPLNHIGLWVDDIHAAVDWMTQQGVRFTPGGIRKGAAGYDVTFIHPKGNDTHPISGNGILIELVQAPPHVVHGMKQINEAPPHVPQEMKLSDTEVPT